MPPHCALRSGSQPSARLRGEEKVSHEPIKKMRSATIAGSGIRGAPASGALPPRFDGSEASSVEFLVEAPCRAADFSNGKEDSHYFQSSAGACEVSHRLRASLALELRLVSVHRLKRSPLRRALSICSVARCGLLLSRLSTEPGHGVVQCCTTSEYFSLSVVQSQGADTGGAAVDQV